MSLPRLRYAPSPTGHLHLGNFATALLTYLRAKSTQGAFLIRMEDVDEQRSKREFADGILRDLEWLGLTWDESPVFQSERYHLYEAAMEQLRGHTYPCFCSRNDLQSLASAPHGISSEGPDYPGFCRDLSPEEVLANSREKDPSIRFRIPHRSYSYTDLIRGEMEFVPGWGGDFIIRRSDGMWAYQLACTVDDLEMGITQVIRGADLIDSTPRQLALMDVLQGKAPEYAHTPLWMGSDGHRLSKRHGDISLRDYRESGFSAEQLIGWMAYYSGLTPSLQSISLPELLDVFRWENIRKSDVSVQVTFDRA
ncbi:tRNA glutamyl-Q(34) synthetase GluQRS [Phaeocystidibacter marisrubri]|uniref:tRNA glutamyl-Q(34) synthetase GluQRS n=1 Tax=Phaeocystidibacter marisrubri TaxID=1577780 RepID=UPI00198A9A38|nr:tRNA glutamyl-Q(34) synthetase GluQRS [Phaeocystidibacter marisrubri]GGH68332.1 glutamyl-Q tRNA(Asp) synthetase [Phaeocystidibacter marisrubri]